MCVIDGEDKRPNAVRSEDQVALGVINNAKIVIANGEHD